MTRDQLDCFVEALGQGWKFRQDSSEPSHPWGIYRNIKNIGYPSHLPEGFTHGGFDEFWNQQITCLQDELIDKDTNGLKITGRSGGWIGWDFSDLLCENEYSPWAHDEFGTITEDTREEIISIAEDIDRYIAMISKPDYWDKIVKGE